MNHLTEERKDILKKVCKKMIRMKIFSYFTGPGKSDATNPDQKT